MDDERLLVQRLSHTERHDLPGFAQNTPGQPQPVHMVERLMKNDHLFLHLLIPLFRAHPHPLVSHRPAVLQILLRQRLIGPVAAVLKTCDVIPLAVELLSGKSRQLPAGINIIVRVAVPLDQKLTRKPHQKLFSVLPAERRHRKLPVLAVADAQQRFNGCPSVPGADRI